MTKAQNQQLSYRLLSSRGFETDTASCFNMKAKRDKDLLGFVDLVGVSNKEFLLVQATAWGSVPARLKKIRASFNAYLCVQIPGVRVFIYGWRQNLKTGKIELREREVTKDDFKECPPRAKQPKPRKRSLSGKRSRTRRK